MHALGVVDLKVYLAKKNHGYSIPAQSYDFCPHLIQLDILDFTLSHMNLPRQTSKPDSLCNTARPTTLFTVTIFCISLEEKLFSPETAASIIQPLK